MQSLLDALKVIIVSVILTPIAYATSSDLVGSAEAIVVQEVELAIEPLQIPLGLLPIPENMEQL